MQQLSGVMCIDIDHKATEELRYLRHILSQEPWVLAYFTSPSGDGLKVLVQSPVTTPEEYENCYAQVIEHFKLHYHCEVDQSCREYSKACYASHDPDLYVNDNAQDYPFRYNPDYDDKRAGDQNNPVPSEISRFEVHQPTVAESFINRLNSQVNSLTDEQILNICDLKFHRYKQNYQVGNRRNSIFQQAAVLCRAGIESVKTLQYLESVFIPAGSPLHEIQAEVSKAYRTYGNLFGSERGNYKNYNEYKKQRSV